MKKNFHRLPIEGLGLATTKICKKFVKKPFPECSNTTKFVKFNHNKFPIVQYVIHLTYTCMYM